MSKLPSKVWPTCLRLESRIFSSITVWHAMEDAYSIGHLLLAPTECSLPGDCQVLRGQDVSPYSGGEELVQKAIDLARSEVREHFPVPAAPPVPL